MVFKGWDKATITTDSGEKKEAVAPLIISASRSTDIPSLFGDWFMDRLDKGYARWVNPFNGKSQYVSFDKVRCIVFWTKNPRPFYAHAATLDKKGIGQVFHVTLNDYEKEGFEPGTGSLDKRIAMFKEFSTLTGKDRLLWRFDPLIVSETLSPRQLLDRVRRAGDRIAASTSRLTISFLVLYAKVKRRLRAAKAGVREFTEWEIAQCAAELGRMGADWGIPVMSCASELNLDRYGISHGKCVDDKLLARLFPDDSKLMKFIGAPNPDFQEHAPVKSLKDPGQRHCCLCIPSKDIGHYSTCSHGCIYCYANGSRCTAMRDCKSWSPDSDSLG